MADMSWLVAARSKSAPTVDMYQSVTTDALLAAFKKRETIRATRNVNNGVKWTKVSFHGIIQSISHEDGSGTSFVMKVMEPGTFQTHEVYLKCVT